MIERRKNMSRMTQASSRPMPPVMGGSNGGAGGSCNGGCNGGAGGGCNGGCNGGASAPSSNCKATLARLQTLDFAIVDTVLYLDAYPECRAALDYYHKLLAERDTLAATLANTCRMPMTNMENVNRDTWDWTRGPWPWESDAN